MKINGRSDEQVTIDNKNIEEMQEFVCQGSTLHFNRTPVTSSHFLILCSTKN